MPKKPHSDQSARAQRRAAAHELARSPRAQQQGIPVNINDLLAKIGALTVERDYLTNQVATLLAQFDRLAQEESEEALEDEAPENLDSSVE